VEILLWLPNVQAISCFFDRKLLTFSTSRDVENFFKAPIKTPQKQEKYKHSRFCAALPIRESFEFFVIFSNKCVVTFTKKCEIPIQPLEKSAFSQLLRMKNFVLKTLRQEQNGFKKRIYRGEKTPF
jgi:hypothetical protein